jgi:DNA polymerase-3 subunit epsilon
MEAFKNRRVLFYDFETTGLPLWREPDDHPGQPHIVELYAELCEGRERRAVLHLIAKPEGWSIPAEVVAIHRMDDAYAQTYGVSEKLIAATLLALSRQAHVRCAHNESFDARIMQIALARYQPAALPEWKAGRTFCTCDAATEILKLPPTDKMLAKGITKPKRASLVEAFAGLVPDKTFEETHRAEHDVWAMQQVYFELMRMKEAA